MNNFDPNIVETLVKRSVVLALPVWGLGSTFSACMALHELIELALIETDSMFEFGQELEQ